MMDLARDLLPSFDLACPYCGRSRELEGGHRVPMDTCCYPRMLSQLGWMAPWLRQHAPGDHGDPDPEWDDIRRGAAHLRRMLAGATRHELDESLQLIAQVAGVRSIVYQQAQDVLRALRAPSRAGHDDR